MGYHVSEANSYLAITGGGIDSVKIVKKAWVWAWQRFATISISPFDLEITLQAMTSEKLQFKLPSVFTIGADDQPESLVKYARILTETAQDGSKRRTMPANGSHVQDIVKGIIEGETRVIVSQMTMEEIFKERQVFKTHVIESVQKELDQFGLRIYNANVKELQDTAGSEYFKFLSRKAHEGAANKAKVDVAEACMKGEIGEAEKRGKTKQEISKIDAETAVLETKRKSEKATADAELTTTQTKLNMGINLANIQAKREAEAQDAELQRTVELKRAAMELEKRRATDLVQATIDRESAQQKAEASLYAETKSADGILYKQRQDAEAQLFAETKAAEGHLLTEKQTAEAQLFTTARAAEGHLITEKQTAEAQLFTTTRAAEGHLITEKQTAEAQLFAITKAAEGHLITEKQTAEAALFTETKAAEATIAKADAALYSTTKEAEALKAMASAYGDLANVLGGPQGLLTYLMLERNTHEQLALANAKAIHGLQPKITVWNTGDQAGAVGAMGGGMGAIKNVMQSLPPLLSTIQEQTGIQPPGWLAQMGGGGSGSGTGRTEGLEKMAKTGQLVNGIHGE